jgi:CO/xanthine dehydrogenase Mo-binding subunit
VRVVSSYVGGAYGSGLRPQHQLFLAVLAARELKRSVRVSLARQQMFGLGYPPNSLQRVALGASADGTMIAEAAAEGVRTSESERQRPQARSVWTWVRRRQRKSPWALSRRCAP